MCIDEGKFYTVMEAKYIGEPVSHTEKELLFGKYMIDNKNPILYKYLEREKKKYTDIIANERLNGIRRNELKQRLDIIEETINEMQ